MLRTVVDLKARRDFMFMCFGVRLFEENVRLV